MDFSFAEVYVNISALFGFPPVMLIGKNGIGKSAVAEEVTRKFKNCHVVGNIDFGGLRQTVDQMMFKHQNTVVIDDLRYILMRKQGVRNAVLGDMSGLISEGNISSATFNSLTLVPIGKKKPMNFIVVGTEEHLMNLYRDQQYDLLNRFLICPLKREVTDFTVDKYKLHTEIHKKYDHDIFNSYTAERMDISQRHNVMLNSTIQELNSIGYNGWQFLNSSTPVVFDPDKARAGINPWGAFTPVKVKEHVMQQVIKPEMVAATEIKIENEVNV